MRIGKNAQGQLVNSSDGKANLLRCFFCCILRHRNGKNL